MKTIKKQISKGKQDLQLDEILQLDNNNTIRINIKSDPYISNCYARIYVWADTKEWSLIDSIHPDNMQTEHEISFSVLDTDYKNYFHLFSNDRKSLIDVAKKVLLNIYY